MAQITTQFMYTTKTVTKVKTTATVKCVAKELVHLTLYRRSADRFI